MNSRLRDVLLIGGGVMAAAIVGGYIGRAYAPAGPQDRETSAQRRPIIQIARQQPGLPSLADTIANLCPSVAAIMPAGSAKSVAAGLAVSADGWVIASAAALPQGDIEVHFGAGPVVAVSEIRTDPVSGLALLKTNATGLTPPALADQSFPRVGDFGFAIQNSAGSGCSAQASMVASDFLADGGASTAYVRLQPMGEDLPAGAPFLSGTGQVVGIVGGGGPANSVIAAEIVGDIADELLRGTLSPTTRFGFRAEDFDATLAGRLSDSRSSGTAVALVEPKSPAAKAGLQAGDIVVGVAGAPVASASELGRALDGAGKSVTMDVSRGSQRLTLTLGRVAGASGR